MSTATRRPRCTLPTHVRAILHGAAASVAATRSWYEDRYLARVASALTSLAEGNAREAADIITSLAEEVQP